MPTVSDDGSYVAFTDEEVRAFNAAGPPEALLLNRLTAEYARRQGGEVLAVIECFEGPRMGQNVKWSPARIAGHLGLAQSRVDGIYAEMMAAVWPIFEASSDYPAFRAWCERHCGKPARRQRTPRRG